MHLGIIMYDYNRQMLSSLPCLFPSIILQTTTNLVPYFDTCVAGIAHECFSDNDCTLLCIPQFSTLLDWQIPLNQNWIFWIIGSQPLAHFLRN